MASKKKNCECRALKSITSNLRDHLQKHHPKEFEELETLEKNVPSTVAKKRKLEFSRTAIQPNLLTMGAVKSVEKYKQNSNLQQEQ